MSDEEIIVHYLDDDKDDLEYFKDAVNLSDNKIRLYTYTNPDELMKNINKKEENGIVLLDLNMPRKNGFEVLRDIRKSEALKDLPVLIYSTSSNETAIGITKDLGADLYIVKPNSFTAVKQLVDKISEINWKSDDREFPGFVYKS